MMEPLLQLPQLLGRECVTSCLLVPRELVLVGFRVVSLATLALDS